MVACKHGHTLLARMLLRRGADLEARNEVSRSGAGSRGLGLGAFGSGATRVAAFLDAAANAVQLAA